jgi:diguanylate cyclase (GGDEF)-like protein
VSRILVIEDDESIRQLLETTLETQGYETLAAEDGRQGLGMALRNAPHLILLDIMLPGLDGLEVCRQLRSSVRTSHIPIIMLTARLSTADKLVALDSGADDYVTKPFDTDELIARIRALLRRMRRGLVSHLTGLPGNAQIEEAIKELVKIGDREWAVVYLDIDRFKEFNDAYGFLKGNELIKATGRIIEDVVGCDGCQEQFELLGHVGGDDFVVITSAERAIPMCRQILRRFDEEAPDHYSAGDRARGYVMTTDRQGRKTRAPIVTLSAGIVTNCFRTIDSYWMVGSIAAEVKKKAKALPGSAYYVDHRR